jgi:isocitrate dehydrogenase (NAD+)
MSYQVSLITGDGIGPEVTQAARACIDATGVNIKWEILEAGQKAIERFGTPLPQSILESIRRNKVALKGPIITPIGEGYRSVNVQMRQALDLYACLRPAKTYEGVRSYLKDIDLVIVRENTEDLYAGIEFDEGKPETKELIRQMELLQPKKIRKDSAISIKPISKFGSERIIRFAFEYALKNKRKKVTVVTKANIMKYSDGLFLKTARGVARDYEGKIEFQEALIDNMAMQLVLKPRNFDILVLPNLYGDIISDLCAGLVGGLGVAPGANIGDSIALFEPVHGAAPKYTGQNKVNPTATILSGVMMLRYLGETEKADKLEMAVQEVIKEGKSVTYDLKADRNDASAVGTQEMARAICQKLR